MELGNNGLQGELINATFAVQTTPMTAAINCHLYKAVHTIHSNTSRQWGMNNNTNSKSIKNSNSNRLLLLIIAIIMIIVVQGNGRNL